MRGIALCCAAFALAGCSLLLSTSDLSGEPSPPDAGPTGTDASEDRASPDDGGGLGDGATGGDATAATFCESLVPKPRFCVDFDGPGAASEGWDYVTVDPPGVGSFVRDALGRDRSSGLVKLSAPQGCSYVRPARSFATTGAGIRVAFSFRPSSPWTTDAVFAFVNLEGPNGGCGILYHLGGGEGPSVHFQFGDPQQDPTFPWDGKLPLDAWSKIETTIEPGKITIAVGGSKAYSSLLPDGCAVGEKFYVAPGFHCEGDVHEARYDDVVVDYP